MNPETVTYVTLMKLFWFLTGINKMDEKEINTLLQSDLFAGFTTQELTGLLDNLYYKINRYNKDDILALSGDRCKDLMVVISGNLIARMVASSGKFVQIDKIGPGRVVAPAILFATHNVYPVNVLIEKEVVLFSVSRSTFLKAMQSNEKLLLNFIRSISDINRFLSEKIRFLSLKTLRGKIAAYLLSASMAQDNTLKVRIKESCQELSEKFGVSRQSLARSISELEDEGILTASARTITILDKNKLRNCE